MNGQHIPIPIPAGPAPATGEALRVEDFTDMWVQFHHGTASSGGLQIQGSIDGANFFDIGTPFNGATSATLEITPKKLTMLRCQKTVTFDVDDEVLTLGFFNVND